jgi:hypothetical protein
MAKKKKIVGIIGLNGEIQKIKDEDNKKNTNTKLNIVGSIDANGNIERYNDLEKKSSGIANSRSRMKESHLQRYNLDGTPKIPIADSITNRNIINLGVKNKLTDSLQNSISQKTGNINQQSTSKIDLSGKSYLQDTGKTYGDYYYDNYSQNKDKKIYINTKDGSYFLNNNGKYEKLGTGITSNINTMTTKSAEDKKIKEARQQGYKGSQSSQKLEKYLKEVSKKTGFTNEELYTIASDYENGKWKPASSKYAEISSRLNKAGYQGYEVANKINKLKQESTQDINTTITNEVFPQKQTPWYKKILKGSEAFDDGYDVGDITKTVVATAQDIGANVGEGFLGTLEGISDTLQYGTADLMDLFRKKSAAKAIRNNAKFNSTAAIFGKNEKEEDNFAKGWTEKVDKNSVAGQGIDSISQGVGNIGAFVGASYLTGGSSASSFLTTFSSAYGNTKSNAYQNGANDKTATEAAIVSGLSEAISEQFFNKIPGMKTQGWGEKLVGKVGSKTEKYFGTKTGKVVMNILDNSGEGFEEIISDILNTTGNNIVHAVDKDYNGNLSLQTDTWLESFVYASITSALVNGGNTVLSNTQKNQILKAYAEENNMTLNQAKSVLNQEIQLRTDNIETNDLRERTNTEKETQKQVLNEMKQNTYTADERISIPQEVEQEVKQEVQEELQEEPNKQPTIPVEKVNEILNDVVKKSDVEFTQEEISELRESMYKQVEKLGAKVEGNIESKQEIKEQNNNNLKLEQRVSGDKLLNAQDLIDEVKSVGAKVDDNGYITLYHQTTSEAAQKIKETGKMISKEKDIFFSTSKDAQQSNGRGNEKLEFKIPAENLVLDDLFSDNADLKISLDGKNELDVSNYIVNNNSNNSIKQKQLDIVKDSNPMQDDYHTGIRTIEDIKTLEETLNDSDYEGYDEFNPDLTRQDIENAIKKGTIMVYSSYPIENGVFVSPSKMEAESYSGNGKVYSKEVSINDVAWIDPTQGQYAKVQNDTLNFKQTKGNIPINEKLLNKYNNVKEMMNSEINNYDGKVDVKDINQINVFNLAKNIFDRYNNKNLFNNNGNEIMVSHADIKESIKHIYNENQIKYLKEHLQVFSDLGDIIESATLSSQGLENKKNMQSTHSHNNIWSYYLNGLKINGETYLLEFDVVSRDNGENHYRVQRIQKTDTSAGNAVNNSITPTLEASASINNDTTKPNKSQIAPSQNSMQQNEKNTPKEKNTIEERIPDVIEVRQSPMDKTSLNKLSKNMAKELYLNNSQTTDLKDVIQDFYRRNFNEYSKKDLFNSIKDKFSEHNEKIIADDSLNDIQQQIRNTKIKVPEQIKEGIGDYNNLRQSNFGKIKLGNTGIELDSFYDELASDYPAYFDSELTGEDQLLRIIDVANMDNSYTETYRLDDNYIQDITDYIDESIKDYKNQELRNLAEKEIKAKYKEDKKTYALPNQRQAKTKQYREQAKKYAEETIDWKDKGLANQKLNTMKRNLRDIAGVKTGNEIYNEYFEPILKHNAEIEKQITKYNEKIKNLKLSNKESTAVQMLGELKHNPQTTIRAKQVNDFIQKNKLDRGKIEKAVEVFRNTYDELFTRVNDVLKEQGYKEIDYRKGYFPHFNEEHGKTILGKFAEKLGWTFKSGSLPTNIAGITDEFKPGKKWTSFSQRRTGDITEYNALKGFDNYVRGAMQVIYHTEDIQKLRALEAEIRYQHSDKGLQEKLDKIFEDDSLFEDEREDRIEYALKDYNNNLGNFVTNLRDYTNNLAGKKSALDRSTEQFAGRKIYNTMDNITRRVSGNMVGGNIASAFTNFIPITQAWSQISTKNMIKSMSNTITNSITKTDNLQDRSNYLTTRTKQADRLFKTGLDKATDKAGIIFEAIDHFTSETIVRGKYYENLEKGMSETEALRNADEFAKDVMAGRSQGDMPTIFNSKNPFVKLFSAFQLEVNNQYGYMFKDLPIAMRNEGMGKLIFAFLKMFLGAWLYNEAAEKLTGRKSAFSPIDIVGEAVDITTNDNLDAFTKGTKITKNISQEIPFVGSLLGGGRIPISSALPDTETTFRSTTNLFKENKREKAIKDLTKELSKPLLYIALPFGGGQAKKTYEGLSMFSDNKEIKGNYTPTGKLRFPIKDTVPKRIQAALFGQYASEEAREYFDQNRSALTENQQKELKVLDIPISDYWEIKSGLSDISNKLKGSNKTTDERKEIYYKYIDSLKINKDKKNLLKKLQYKSYTESDEDIKDYISSIKAKKTTKKDLLKKMGLDD